MATLDPRILDLIETLTIARLDWLAFEIVEGIQAGYVPTESSETLADTRRRVREDDQPKATGEPKPVTLESEPVEGDAQINWAAKYVGERLDATLVYLAESIENLDALAIADG